MRLFFLFWAFMPCFFHAKTIRHVILDSPGYIGGAGLFHNFNIVLGCLELYDSKEEMALSIDFRQEGLYYEPLYGDNWWSYYFDQTTYPAKKQHPSKPIYKLLKDEEKAAFGNGVHFHIQREKAHELISKYIRLKQEIVYEVNEFAKAHFKEKVIGVHYRATDKWQEAEYVAIENVIEAIHKQLEIMPDATIFLATDDQNALEAVQKKIPRVVYKDHERSRKNEPLHYFTAQPYQQGREALVDALLLSHSHVLIRTNSNLSAVSAFFNPYMQVITVNDLNSSLLEGISKQGDVNSLNKGCLR